MIKRVLSSGFVLALSLSSTLSMAAKKGDDKASTDCTVSVYGTAEMKFSLVDSKNGPAIPDATLKLPKKCMDQKITVKIKNSSGLPKAAMGHNIVFVETANLEKAATSPDNAAANEFVGPSVKSLVIAHSKVTGDAALTDEVVIPAKTFKAGKDYSYYCSFPGHFALMKGKFVFAD
jgi:azurin